MRCGRSAPGFTLLRIDPEGARPPSAVRGIKAFGVVAEGAGRLGDRTGPGQRPAGACVAAWAGERARPDQVDGARRSGERRGRRVGHRTPGRAAVARRPRTRRARSTSARGPGASPSPAAHVWVANAARGTVTKVDPRTHRVDFGHPHRQRAPGLAAAADRLWVTVAAAGGVPARDAGRAASGGVRSSTCSEVISDTENPQRLIVSDLPLRRAGIGTLPDAIGFVLRRHGFRAGSIRLGYQSCDDSTAQSGRLGRSEVPRERRSVREDAARDRDRRSVQFGLHASSSSATTNRAPGGPLATISPTNSLLELTKPVPGRPARPARRALSHRRAPLRPAVPPPRRAGCRPGALCARARVPPRHDRRRRTFIRPRALPDARRTARELGLDVVGPRAAERPAAAPPTPLERAPARRRASGRAAVRSVRLGRRLPFVRQARARLGADFPVLASGRLVARRVGLRRAGPAAEDTPCRPRTARAAAGPRRTAVRARVRRFTAGRQGVDRSGLRGAGDRDPARCDRALGRHPALGYPCVLATDIRDGLIGDVRFDRDGDVNPRPFTIFRLVDSPMETSLLPDGSNIIAVVDA